MDPRPERRRIELAAGDEEGIGLCAAAVDLQDELPAQVLGFDGVAGARDVLMFAPAALDAVIPVGEQKPERVLGEQERKKAVGKQRRGLRERRQLKHDALDERETVGKGGRSVGDGQEIIGRRTAVAGHVVEAVMESACELDSAGEACGDAEAGADADGEALLARLDG
jgi:hypothetical protein